MEVTEHFRKILLVDDDIDLLEQNKILLVSKGFEVRTAESGEEGFKLFKDISPDAAIVDLMMEEPDAGFILCHRIKKTEHGKKIPVFILTSATYETGFKFSATTPEEREWIKSDGILNKPVSIEELISKLENFRNK
ncbi:MAG: response regulator [Ignavibacteriae bacterium HGW-Ignavibacteriae-2]|jgi:DNA-binding response OmpR family regulator|nr:response regulator [Bacteroidota bacterium]PKL88562.1 MAG: response regulator [Ignavibacteriae bacterium HGW-Ignavibacteriae-2]